MQNIVLVTINPNQAWEVYAWRNGDWSELIGLFETESQAEIAAARYQVPVVKNMTTEQASEQAHTLYQAQLCNQLAA